MPPQNGPYGKKTPIGPAMDKRTPTNPPVRTTKTGAQVGKPPASR